jgi:hypothetical protein
MRVGEAVTLRLEGVGLSEVIAAGVTFSRPIAEIRPAGLRDYVLLAVTPGEASVSGKAVFSDGSESRFAITSTRTIDGSTIAYETIGALSVEEALPPD